MRGTSLGFRERVVRNWGRGKAGGGGSGSRPVCGIEVDARPSEVGGDYPLRAREQLFCTKPPHATFSLPLTLFQLLFLSLGSSHAFLQ